MGKRLNQSVRVRDEFILGRLRYRNRKEDGAAESLGVSPLMVMKEIYIVTPFS